MQTPWGLIHTHHPPEAQGVPCLIVDCARGHLAVSLRGFEALPDEESCWWDWLGYNDNEAPFAWRDRRPTY